MDKLETAWESRWLPDYKKDFRRRSAWTKTEYTGMNTMVKTQSIY